MPERSKIAHYCAPQLGCAFYAVFNGKTLAMPRFLLNSYAGFRWTVLAIMPNQ
jgi:hypothetical protein